MKKNVVRRCLMGLLSFTTFAHAAAGEEFAAGDEAELQDLMAILEQQTEIATRTRMNADYVPGLVTVLHGDELEALGARTVWDALRLVPGIEPSADNIGGRQTLVRGVGGTFASGNMKILLNNQSMNSALSASAQPVLFMPVEQVAQIEVIRGPGSAVHGEFAFAGVINVITRKNADGVYLRAGEHDTYGAGAFRHWQSEDGRSGGSINLGGWRSAGAGIDSGKDAMYGGTNGLQAALSNAPGPVNDAARQHALMLDLHRDGYALSVSYLEDGTGDHFGTINALAPAGRDHDYINRYFTVTGKGTWRLSENLSTELRLGWQYHENEFDIRVLPAGFTWFNSSQQLVTLPHGLLSRGYYEEQRTSADFDVHWNGWRDQSWLLSVGAARISVGESWQDNTYDPVSRNPFPGRRRITHEQGADWPSGNRSRDILSLTLQDEYRASENVTLTAGLRYDDYDDFGSNLSPRLAAVWRLDRRHILKAQYAEAFRPPTFYETVWNDGIDPETIRTGELAYIYKAPATEFRLTAFRSRLKDLIVASGILGYRNIGGARVNGVEAELEQRLTSTLKLKTNLTLNDTEQTDTGGTVPGAANRLANLALIFQPRSTHSYSVWLRHVGKRAREEGDPRGKLAGYETVDATASFADVGIKNLGLRIGVSNLLDRRVRYPAFQTLDIIGMPITSYPDDYPQSGRAAWIQIAYRM